jgi:uncharacterized protein with HEPN domain
MPKREIIVRLEDVRQFILEIDKMVVEINSYDKLKKSKTYQLAFERAFELIGEALNQIRKERADITITNIKKMIGLRNIIVHEYYGVEYERLWMAATKNLPLLKIEIEKLIDEENLKLFGTSNPNL